LAGLKESDKIMTGESADMTDYKDACLFDHRIKEYIGRCLETVVAKKGTGDFGI
jgi:hypothetical protein